MLNSVFPNTGHARNERLERGRSTLARDAHRDFALVVTCAPTRFLEEFVERLFPVELSHRVQLGVREAGEEGSLSDAGIAHDYGFEGCRFWFGFLSMISLLRVGRCSIIVVSRHEHAARTASATALEDHDLRVFLMLFAY
jgi:hypothetical protein